MKYRTLTVCLASLILAGCGSESGGPADPGDPNEPVLDDQGRQVVTPTVPSLPAGGIEIFGAEIEVPSGQERQFCRFDTYRGDTVGLTALTSYQGTFGHHIVILETSYTPEEFPDGSVLDCTARDSFDMVRTSPLFVPGRDEETEQARTSLPDGLAIRLRSGTRYMVQSHYINTSKHPLVATDAVHFESIPEAEVETWAATIAHSSVLFEIPPRETIEASVDCTFDTDVQVVSIGSHMHEFGTAFSVDWTRGDGSRERIYDIPEWDPGFRDDAPITDHSADPLDVLAGDVFTTRCEWRNTTDEAIIFPREMCASIFVGYPLEETVTCADILGL